ncbi:site-2 protease family protein [Microaceticoccus formicicus]|uniref:site-2 protease family protein n=1 Tax=Microaceticoccus formicicus TaxID=3118105 RepID=UPI003CD022AE|nr:site-2 protease family protein [Peptoniphilaceae bacterium AMB_02]
MNLSNLNIETIIVTAVALLITIVLHELAHGYMALALGDDTAQRMGRLTLNPLAHLNLPGVLSLLIFKFGWANPVPINFNRLKPRRLGIILVSIAGVSMNLVLAFFASFGYVYTLYHKSNVLFSEFFALLLIYNISFAVFNLLPLPPLDGSKLVVSFFPTQFQVKFYMYEKYFYFLLLFLVFTRTINTIIGPVVQTIFRIFVNIAAGFIIK